VALFEVSDELAERGAAPGETIDFHARDKSLYLTWLADSYIDAAEVEQAASVMSRVLGLSAGIGSVRPRQRAVTVIQRLASHRHLPLVADLMDRAAS
jgi:hypothetical protein